MGTVSAIHQNYLEVKATDGKTAAFTLSEKTTLFKGMEQLPDVLTDPRSLRDAYLKEVEAYLREIRMGCRAVGADYLLVRTDQPIDVVLSTFLAPRMQKMQ